MRLSGQSFELKVAGLAGPEQRLPTAQVADVFHALARRALWT